MPPGNSQEAPWRLHEALFPGGSQEASRILPEGSQEASSTLPGGIIYRDYRGETIFALGFLGPRRHGEDQGQGQEDQGTLKQPSRPILPGPSGLAPVPPLDPLEVPPASWVVLGFVVLAASWDLPGSLLGASWEHSGSILEAS